jgi:hypothetical protein
VAVCAVTYGCTTGTSKCLNPQPLPPYCGNDGLAANPGAGGDDASGTGGLFGEGDGGIRYMADASTGFGGPPLSGEDDASAVDAATAPDAGVLLTDASVSSDASGTTDGSVSSQPTDAGAPHDASADVVSVDSGEPGD